MWINFLIPKIEDGNNFGVSIQVCRLSYKIESETCNLYVPFCFFISLPCNFLMFQEDVVAEARQVESEAASYLDQISRYYLQRARIISKIAKYPHIVSLFIYFIML